MPAIITTKTRIFLAKQFLDSFTNIDNPRGLYLFVGKVTPWDDDGAAPLPANTEGMIRDAWKQMIGGKRVSPADYSHVVRRVDWALNKVFTQYDDNNTNLFYTDFYCITDDFNVYKCLDNNNGAPSTIKPTGQGTSVITLGDGYRWKFMYSVSIAGAMKFMTNRWIPVQTLLVDDGTAQWTVQQNTLPGAIQNIVVDEAGSGYTGTPTITIEGDGTGATAVAVMNSGTIEKITITNPGSGYNNANIIITGGTPSVEAELRAIFAPLPQGHGYSAIDELGAFYIMCNTELQQDESDNLPVVNDFRHIGLVADPTESADPGEPASILAFNQTTRLQITSATGDFLLDEVVTGLLSGATGNVVQWDSDNSDLSVNNVVGEFVAGEGVTTTSGSGAVSSIIDPELTQYTGDLIFMEYRAPLSRAEDQTEQVRVIFEF